MNKLALLTLSIAMTASVLAGPLASQEIVVSPTAHATYVSNVQNDLNQQLKRVRFTGVDEPTGITSVRFQADENGKPVNIRTYRRSGSSRLDNAARRAVSKLSSLAPQDYDVEDGQIFQANIIMAASDTHFARLADQLARDETRRIASSPKERAVLAITLVPSPVS